MIQIPARIRDLRPAHVLAVAGADRRGLAQLLLAILLVQTVYWGLIAPVFNNDAVDRMAMDRAEIAALDAPDAEALETAEFAPAAMPFTLCCDPNYAAARFHLTLPEVPTSGLGVIPVMQVDNYILLANGHEAFRAGRMELGSQSFHGQIVDLRHVPAGLLREGDNTLTFITVRSGASYTDFNTPVVNDYETLQRQAAKRLYFLNGYRVHVAILVFTLGLLALLLLVRSSETAFSAWLAVLCFAWAGNSTYSIFADPPWGATGRQIYYFALTNLIPVALFGLVDAWTRRPMVRAQAALTGAYLLLIAAIVGGMVWAPMPARFDFADVTTSWFLLGVTILIGLRLAWHFLSGTDDRRAEVAILSVCAVAVAMDAGNELIHHKPGGNLNQATPFLIFAMAAAFINRNFRLFRSSAQINALLTDRLDKREAELETAHRREKRFLREQAFQEERQRIMRDMHDGMGSQLMSLLLAARRGRMEPDQAAEGLQGVIDDMRLMIDSMDSVGESLGSALTLFRERAHQRVESAGFAFEWREQDDVRLPQLQPRQVLQVFRILQEAIANALKHSGGGRVTVTIAPAADHPAATEIEIRDDGAGIGAAPGHGRGLDNMRARAASIGATLDIGGDEDGAVVRLRLPAPGAA